ncbi:MAG TPA: 3-hydroxyacyl-CoA dehydrogenase NAD-binding domain-containing protein [Steroidobacteraceae bacterium]|jgi:carnitine 3-dehydrogenase|nr:3-hydroxyacyl-CoA dehydrogenase NAD-binding domain-containing protein [Steroidobacteraceae bacterium]
MRNVKTLGLLGTGVIGGGWAARALHFGIDVIAADVKPEMEAWIRGAVANAEPALARLTSAPLPPKGTLSFTTDARVMAERADFIQENIPEQLALKQRMLAEVSRYAAADVIIASSTSGLTPTDLQRDMVSPERFLVAHPFNPVYLLPLVELVGGRNTAAATIAASARFFTYIGMHALEVRREVPGHLTDRLQEAIWREILHMVNDGVATTGELDDSIIYGPGLRWAAMGTNMIYHLAGGEAGMRHMLAQFGPALKWPWTKLEAPELTESLIDKMVEGTQAQAAGRSIRELERLRDDYLVAIQQVLRQYDIGAGSTLRALEERLYKDAGVGAASAPGGAGSAAQLPRFDTVVRPEWTDYNMHMSDFHYGHIFGDAMDALYRQLGIDEAYRKKGRMFYTVESHIKHLAEAKVGEPLYVTTQILGADAKRLHVFHRLHRRGDDALIATGEQMHLHVNTKEAKATPVDAATGAALDSLSRAHVALPLPSEAGKPVGSRAKH